MRRLFLLTFLIALPVLATSPKHAFKAAPIVFEGVVQRVDSDGATFFTVTRQWKGEPVAETIVTNDRPPLQVGARYVVIPTAARRIAIVDRGEDSELARLLDGRAGWWRSRWSGFPNNVVERMLVLSFRR
ncbi:MAG TPA: hypothetical protein VGF48_16345 [Thermoanaerobaculia bacterium]|jgi:hypothetical protein